MSDFALVTGGSQGIGRAICERLKRDGCEPLIFDLVPPDDAALGTFFEVDLSDREATAAALGEATRDRAVTRLVNNVGIVVPAWLEEATLEDFDRVMALNVRCAIQCTQAVVPAMKAARFGRIVNISSRSALGKELRTNYSASKAALIGMARTWALELAPHGITANVIAPGPIATPLYRAANPADDPKTQAALAAIPVGRMGRPEDIAAAAAYFLHADSSFVTGQTLFVCGGSSVRAAF